MNSCKMYYFNFVLSILFAYTYALKVEDVTFNFHTIQVDHHTNFQAVIFSFRFDQEIQFQSVNDTNDKRDQPLLISSPLPSFAVDICFPPLDCSPPLPFSANLYDLIMLSCSSEEVYSKPIHNEDFNGLSPPSYLMFFPGSSSSESLLDFFSMAGFLGGFTTPIDAKKLNAILLLSYAEKGVPYFFGGKFRKVKEDLVAGRCSLKFGVNDNFNIIGSQDTEPFFGEYAAFRPAPTVACSYFSSLTISTSISSNIKKMESIESFDSLQGLQFQNALLEGSNIITSCKAVIESYMTYENKVVNFPSSVDCMRGPNDPLYSVDPCCNTTLQFYYCCAPSQKEVTIQTLNSLDVTRATCKNIDQSSSLLSDYIVNMNNAEDPTQGCRAISGAIANETLFLRYTSFIDECLLRVIGTDLIDIAHPPTCETDDDCETYCRNSGICYFDPFNIDEAMLQCHMKLMDPVVVGLLKVEWNLPASTTKAQFKNEYFKRMRTDNCVGATGSRYNWQADAKGDLQWVHKESECLSNMICSYDATLPEDQCETSDSTCVFNIDGFTYPITYPEFCYSKFVSQELCDTIPGSIWDINKQPFECTLPFISSFDECVPPHICPPPKSNDYYEGCERSMCVGPQTKEECVSNCSLSTLIKWNNNVKSGDGFCEILVSNMTTCEENNGQWWQGRGWVKGLYNSKEKCDKGACETGNIIYIGRDNCSALEECSQTCQTCESKEVGLTLCFSNNMTVCECQIAGGSYDSEYEICTFEYSKEDCLGLELQWAACKELSKLACTACAQGDTSLCPPYYELLQCDNSWTSICASESECLSGAGRCTDPFFNRNEECDFVATFLEFPDCSGSCVHELTPFPSGAWGCVEEGEIITPLGCIVGGVVNKSYCESLPGHWWREHSKDKDECERDMGCLTTSINLQNQTECTNCKGTYDSIYTWTPGEWKRATSLPLAWVEKEWKRANEWKPTLDFQIILNTVSRVISAQFSLALQTESMCLYNPLLEVINHIACDCTQDSSAPPNCYTGGTRITSIGVQRLYAGTPDSIKAGPIIINVFANTVPVSILYIDVDIDIASASQFKQQQALTSNALSSSFGKNPYAIVSNSHNAIVGQLVGDGVILSFLPTQYSQSRRDVNFEFENPLQVCVQVRSDISKSRDDFPVPTFAVTTDFKKWTPVDGDVVVTSTGYCLDVKHEGIYFPILRVAGDWTQVKSKPLIDDDVLLAFIYIFGVVYMLLAFVSVYQIHCSRKKLIGKKQKINLGVVLFFFLSLFCVVRGLYLLILPSEVLEDNEAAKYFLSESPQFFFFSVYSVIIFLWAEISTLVVSRDSFLHKFKWPFVITNIALYVLFVSVVSIYHVISPEHQSNVKKAYVFILAACCLVAAVAFNVFGRKLINIQLSSRKIKTKLSNSTLSRMVITLVVSTLTIIAQIIFLFVITYDSVSPAIALVAYVLTEVIPCITLIYTLRPLSQKFKKIPTSTEMKKKISSADSIQKQKEEELGRQQKEREIDGITIQTGPFPTSSYSN